MEESDITLIDSYLNGSDAAFERLYHRYRQPLYGYLCGMLSRAEADDVFQRTWLRVCASLPRYRCRGKFQAWLFRIGRNQAVDHIRARNRRNGREVPGELPDVAGDSEPWRELADAELRQVLTAALVQLAPEQRAVFEMRNREIAFRVIAERQACSVNTAIMRMRYAMGKLRDILGNQSE